MVKKRVHELAKEFGLENREAIALLKRSGISAKTHSSSVDEDEARSALSKSGKSAPVEEKKVKPRRPGMRIVRKRKEDIAVEVADAAGTAADTVSVGTGAVADTTDSSVVPEAAPPEANEVPARPATAAAAAAAFAAKEAAAEKEAAAKEAAEKSAAEAAAAQKASAQEAPESAQTSAEGQASAAASTEGKGSTDGKAQSPAENAKPVVPGKPRIGAQVVRMIDREKLLERVPSNRLGGGPDGRGGPRGGRSFGQVTELKVVTDPFGRGREMVQVTRDKKGAKTAGRRPARAQKRGRNPMRERAMFPSRLRKKKSGGKKSGLRSESIPQKASKRVVKMKETISVQDFAMQLQAKAGDVLRALMTAGVQATLNAQIDFDTAQIIAEEFQFTVESIAFDEAQVLAEAQEEVQEHWVARPPIVTIMGHVDHGKTSVLDAIRKTAVTEGEAGGITQHIGAYSITLDGKKITFLDTPGHAAFTSMRARGAQVTDIVVLVVAGDDGVMPQTEEAIRHAQDAGVPIIVAINKMDKPESNAERVTQELSKFNLLPESWGGETLYVETSAITGAGLDTLLETILLQADILELHADPDREAQGAVVEATLDKGRGPVVTVLIQHGKLSRGDYLVVGEHMGKVRAMTDHTGKALKVAGPSDAVEIIGLDGVPEAGDKFNAVDSRDKASEVAKHRQDQRKAAETTKGNNKMSLEDLMAKMKGGESPELKLVLKADVQGSVEAVRASVEKLATDEVKLKVVFGAVGGVKESDIMLASATDGIVVGFNVRPDGKARTLAQREGVEIRTYSIIYELIDDVKKAMEGLLTPETREKVVGRAEVREIFKVSKIGTVGGSRVIDGKASKAARVRIVRDSVSIYDGKVGSLRHFKDDVREVDQGLECGISVEGYQDIKAGDIFEFFEVEHIQRTLDGGVRA